MTILKKAQPNPIKYSQGILGLPYFILFCAVVLSGCDLDFGSLRRTQQLASYKAIAVQKGDTLYSIARRYDTNVRDLITANNFKAPFKIYPGQGIRLPQKRIHIVRKFETIETIARDRQISRNELVRMNMLMPPYRLHENQRLTLPPPYSDQSHIQQIKKKLKPEHAASSPSHQNHPPLSHRKPTQTTNQKAKPKPVLEQPKAFNPNRAEWKSEFIQPHSTPISRPTTVPRPKPTLDHKPDQRHNQPAQQSRFAPPPAKPSGISPASTKLTASQKINASSKAIIFQWPLRGQIMSKYGALQNGLKNDGINIKAKHGAAVRASESGTIVYTGNALKGYGNLILMRHRQGYITTYAHLKSTTIRKGQTVTKGKIIGYVGTTGTVKRPQLHFEIRKKRQTLDPIKLLT